MERQQSNTLHTPNISNTLSTGDVKFTSGDLRDLSAVLKNCPEVNQLWRNHSEWGWVMRNYVNNLVEMNNQLWKRTSVIERKSSGEKNLKQESIKSNSISVFHHDIFNQNTQCLYIPQLVPVFSSSILPGNSKTIVTVSYLYTFYETFHASCTSWSSPDFHFPSAFPDSLPGCFLYIVFPVIPSAESGNPAMPRLQLT